MQKRKEELPQRELHRRRAVFGRIGQPVSSSPIFGSFQHFLGQFIGQAEELRILLTAADAHRKWLLQMTSAKRRIQERKKRLSRQ